ncbi:galactose mutarotase-like protein [Rozella allomycis CSF55]|uniref:Galactose mutarotase-like domain-containing protein n=1 Tax=Rozella allomycis (strain CSF55) TaxID=988480 RepID=A0A075AMP5_ROZAC|nr:Galactose mutarotase-like domain-containing protein [Rozella allomycis CSF55]RKP20463.1 galactose mutarotase-like protein [Rozella allomycis CSF55]|eukprot:EPZ30931.1 Galactose mutarotase-like domain-containing protein [Rozella allomycis CSF55]
MLGKFLCSLLRKVNEKPSKVYGKEETLANHQLHRKNEILATSFAAEIPRTITEGGLGISEKLNLNPIRKFKKSSIILEGERSAGFVNITFGKSSCTINPVGATIVDYSVDGVPVLGIYKEREILNSEHVNGGIPIIFPFGTRPGEDISSGQLWIWDEKVLENSNFTETSFILCDNESTRSIWPHSFKLTYTVMLYENVLKTRIYVENMSLQTFDFTILFHNYLNLYFTQFAALEGVKGALFNEFGLDYEEVKDCRPSVFVQREIDRIYWDIKRPLKLNYDLGYVNITLQGFPDISLWNPAIQDHHYQDKKEFKKMICVIPGNFTKPSVLEPAGKWQGEQILNPVFQ